MDRPFRVQVIREGEEWPTYLMDNGVIIEYGSREGAADDVATMMRRATKSIYIVVDLREQQ